MINHSPCLKVLNVPAGPDLMEKLKKGIVYCAGGVLVPPTIAYFNYTRSQLTFINVSKEEAPVAYGYYDSCGGGSGGPFWIWVKKDSRTRVAVLIGATNAGSAVCGEQPAMYTNLLLDYVQKWIFEEVGPKFDNRTLSLAPSHIKNPVLLFTLLLIPCIS